MLHTPRAFSGLSRNFIRKALSMKASKFLLTAGDVKLHFQTMSYAWMKMCIKTDKIKQ